MSKAEARASMKYPNRIGLIVFGAVLFGTLFFGQAEPAGAANVAGAKWEYAYFLNSRTQLKTAFNSPRESVHAENAFALYHKLGGRKSESEFTLADLTSHLGAQGWEMVSVETQENVLATYWFKRVVP